MARGQWSVGIEVRGSSTMREIDGLSEYAALDVYQTMIEVVDDEIVVRLQLIDPAGVIWQEYRP